MLEHEQTRNPTLQAWQDTLNKQPPAWYAARGCGDGLIGFLTHSETLAASLHTRMSNRQSGRVHIGYRDSPPRKSGCIHVGYGDSTLNIALPFTPSRVEVDFTCEGWQVCGGAKPELSPVIIVENGFTIEVKVTSNVGTLHWRAYA